MLASAFCDDMDPASGLLGRLDLGILYSGIPWRLTRSAAFSLGRRAQWQYCCQGHSGCGDLTPAQPLLSTLPHGRVQP